MKKDIIDNSDSIVEELLELAEKNITINADFYETYNVKRGLRNSDNTGVLVGLTVIGEVHAYIFDENEKVDVPGRLSYRGGDVKEIVPRCIDEDRFCLE